MDSLLYMLVLAHELHESLQEMLYVRDKQLCSGATYRRLIFRLFSWVLYMRP